MPRFVGEGKMIVLPEWEGQSWVACSPEEGVTRPVAWALSQQ